MTAPYLEEWVQFEQNLVMIVDLIINRLPKGSWQKYTSTMMCRIPGGVLWEDCQFRVAVVNLPIGPSLSLLRPQLGTVLVVSYIADFSIKIIILRLPETPQPSVANLL